MARPLILRQHAVLAALEEMTGTHPGSERVDAVLGLMENESGTVVTVQGGVEVTRTRDELVFGRADGESEFSVAVSVGREYTVAGFHFASALVDARGPSSGPNVEFADAGRAGDGAMTLRTWRDGDAFIPLGMSGRKKISDFFVDEKVPVHDKGRIPLLLSARGEVIWVCGMRLDDRFKITTATRRVLRLEFSSPTDR
jgi:tRNA(Ile)-lysidine synthetase-like protein